MIFSCVFRFCRKNCDLREYCFAATLGSKAILEELRSSKNSKTFGLHIFCVTNSTSEKWCKIYWNFIFLGCKIWAVFGRQVRFYENVRIESFSAFRTACTFVFMIKAKNCWNPSFVCVKLFQTKSRNTHYRILHTIHPTIFKFFRSTISFCENVRIASCCVFQTR